MDPFGDKPQAFGPFSDGVMSFQSPRRPFWGLEKSFPPRKNASPNPKDGANHLEFVSGAFLLGWEARVEPSGEKWDRFILLVEAIVTPT